MYWLTKQNEIRSIVFVENSGYSLDILRAVVKKYNPGNKKVEFVQYKYKPRNDLNTSTGELHAIDFALKHSKLLSKAKYFTKVTGRIYIGNITKIVRNLPSKFHAICSLSENLMYVDSVIGIFETQYYKDWIQRPAMKHMTQPSDKRMDFERAWARAIHASLAYDHMWYPFFVQPSLVGMSGAKNSPYRNNAWRSKKITLASRPYHYYFRNSFGSNRKHLFDRWNITPIK